VAAAEVLPEDGDEEARAEAVAVAGVEAEEDAGAEDVPGDEAGDETGRSPSADEGPGPLAVGDGRSVGVIRLGRPPTSMSATGAGSPTVSPPPSPSISAAPPSSAPAPSTAQRPSSTFGRDGAR
jgi:hypothetical protein